MYIVPEVVHQMEYGFFRLAEVEGPPSPLNPATPEPATLVMRDNVFVYTNDGLLVGWRLGWLDGWLLGLLVGLEGFCVGLLVGVEGHCVGCSVGCRLG